MRYEFIALQQDKKTKFFSREHTQMLNFKLFNKQKTNKWIARKIFRVTLLKTLVLLSCLTEVHSVTPYIYTLLNKIIIIKNGLQLTGFPQQDNKTKLQDRAIFVVL